MKFGEEAYKVAGIDDVATCPVLERRGIGRQLMANALTFMKSRQVDLSLLAADPRGHAKKIYWRAGYQYTTYLAVALKAISIRNVITHFTPGTPLAFPLRLYGAYHSARRRGKFPRGLSCEILGKDQDAFRKKLNANYRDLHSFAPFTPQYWNWYHMERPHPYKSVVLAIKSDDQIIAGGVITKSYLILFHTKKWFPVYLLTEIFVDEPYRRQAIGSLLLSQLERIAQNDGVGTIMLQYHAANTALHSLLTKMGYLCIKNVDILMMKPLSERATALFVHKKGKLFAWKTPWEQLGY